MHAVFYSLSAVSREIQIFAAEKILVLRVFPGRLDKTHGCKQLVTVARFLYSDVF